MIKSEKIEVNESGINILRNGIRTEHIEYSQINYAEIKRGFRLKTWFVSLTTGILLLIISGNWLINILLNFDYNSQNYSGDIRSPWLLLISGIFIGIMSIMIVKSSVERTMILYLFMSDKRKRIALTDLEKKGLISELYSFLDNKVEIVT